MIWTKLKRFNGATLSLANSTPKFPHIPAIISIIPPGKNFTVSDIKINDEPITFGSQIADFITIKIIGQAFGFGKNRVAAFTRCEGIAAFAKVHSVEDAIRRTVMSNTR